MNITNFQVLKTQVFAIADGVAFTDKIVNLSGTILGIDFYSSVDADRSTFVPISTMTGTVNVTGTMSQYDDDKPGDGEQYGTVENGQVTLGAATYALPNALGVTRYRIDPTTIISPGAATHYKITIKGFV